MDGIDIRKLYGTHTNEIYVIDYFYRGKIKTEEFRYNTQTQRSIHTYTKNGGEKQFLWNEYNITWAVKEIKPCDYTLREWVIQFQQKNKLKPNYYADCNFIDHNGYKKALEDLQKLKEKDKSFSPFPIWIVAAELQQIGNEQ